MENIRRQQVSQKGLLSYHTKGKLNPKAIGARGAVQFLDMSDPASTTGTNMDAQDRQDGDISPSDLRSSMNSARLF
jgi:hypothetical protein